MASYKPISGDAIQRMASNVAASGYYLKGYEAGTTTALAMGIDATPTSTLAKCQINSEGYAINGSSAVFIPHFNADYKLVLYANSTDADADTFANAVYAIDNIILSGSNITISDFNKYDAIADVRSIANSPAAGDVILLYGYTTVNDMEPAQYYWDASSIETDDGGGIIKLTAITTGRYKILPKAGKYNAQWWGFIADGSTAMGGKCTAAINYVNGLGGGTVYIPRDDNEYIITPNATDCVLMNDNIYLEIQKGATLKSDAYGSSVGRVVWIAGGASAAHHPERIQNTRIGGGGVIDGNRDNHTKTTDTTATATASSTTITTTNSVFASGDVGKRIYVEFNDHSADITNIIASGSDTIITCTGINCKVGEKIVMTGITGSGDYTAMNNQKFTITAITRDFLSVIQSVTISNTLSSGSYTSGGAVNTGYLRSRIASFVSATEVTMDDAAIFSVSSATIRIEEGEQTMGLWIAGADNCIVDDLTFQNSWGDGIYLAQEFGSADYKTAASRNISINNVHCKNNRRNGLSVISAEYLSVTNSWFTGQQGTGPAAGVDVEPNEETCRHLSFSNCFFNDNEGEGFTISKKFSDSSGTPLVIGAANGYGTWSVVVSNCHFLRNLNYGIKVGTTNEGVNFTNCFVNFNRKGGVRVTGQSTGKRSGAVRFSDTQIMWNVEFKGDSGTPDDVNNGHGIVMSLDTTTSDVRQYDVRIRGCSIGWNEGHGVFSSGETVENCAITDNFIWCNSQLTDNTWSNIRVIGEQSSGLQIYLNNVKQKYTSDDTFGQTQTKFPKYGIEVLTGSNDNSVIAQNDVYDGGKTANLNVTDSLITTRSRYNVVQNNFGYVTDGNSRSSAIDISTTGVKTTTIAHGLDVIPLMEHVSVSLVDDIGGTVVSANPVIDYGPIVTAIDATNITVKFNVATGGTGNLRVSCRVGSGNTSF